MLYNVLIASCIEAADVPLVMWIRKLNVPELATLSEDTLLRAVIAAK